MRKVTHQTLSEELSHSVLLPCLFTLRSPAATAGPSNEPPRVKWTKVWGQRGSDGLQREQSVLVAKDNVVKVKKAFQGRVALPGYQANRYNASLLLSGLRSSDSGLYRCEVVVGINDEQDTVPLEVTGVVFHYRAPHDRYALSFADAQRVCLENSGVIASPEQLQATFADGYDNCDAGWLADQTVRYPIQSPRPGCYGDREDSPGVRTYGNRSPEELFDVYCFAKQLQGDVFHSSVPEKLSLATASTHCHSLGAQLATAGQLHLAWQAGLDQCDPGWLADGSVRYPINVPRRNCGGEDPGVRTVYHNPNRTGFPDTTALFDAYCYRAHQPSGLQVSEAVDLLRTTNPSEATPSGPWPRHAAPQHQPSTWTGLVDLDKEPVRSIVRSTDSSEISEEHVVIHLRPEETFQSQGPSQTSSPTQGASGGPKTSNLGLPALGSLETQGGSAHEDKGVEEDSHFGSSEPPSFSVSSSTPQLQTSNSVLAEFVQSLMKPFRYWAAGEETQDPSLATSVPGWKAVGSPAPAEPERGSRTLEKAEGSKGSLDNSISEHPGRGPSIQASPNRVVVPEAGLLEQEREVGPFVSSVPAIETPGGGDSAAQSAGRDPNSSSTNAPDSSNDLGPVMLPCQT
ncbi:neurocan core protein-like [Aplochiton taeniatus]